MTQDMKLKIESTYENLKSAVEALGLEWGFWNMPGVPMSKVQIQGNSLNLDIYEETLASSRSRFTSKVQENGRLRISFGSSPYKKSFPEPKKGFDFGKIAKEIALFVRANKG